MIVISSRTFVLPSFEALMITTSRCNTDDDPAQLREERWRPDYGPAEFVASWGATVTGVRKFLIAYNVNLLSTKEQAHR